ncbi:MAG TPA: dihydroxyacetone kinase subunit L [Lapidilactobacillus dextrinicus]|uniref:phosphoenolpyruvate--glycerone phosphotransferase n=1 Tax=Lapidilactobacillus dextrinicus TaxID=51664 RepID=A0A921DVP9_9LACO|nr:dihydroxyacetone kinase subunit L [Lapidilactobacillus dextrinicus]
MFTPENTNKWLQNFAEKIETNHAYLSELDTPIGDADHGNNMVRGIEAMKLGLDKLTNPTLQDVFKTTAMALISKVGGASGPLYGTAFLEMAKQSATTTEPATLLSAALSGIKKRGGAIVGDKTMVDVWEPLVAKITTNELTREDIDTSVEATKDMQAKKGRASYLGERSIGHIDPGAMSSGYLFTALIETEGIL